MKCFTIRAVFFVVLWLSSVVQAGVDPLNIGGQPVYTDGSDYNGPLYIGEYLLSKEMFEGKEELLKGLAFISANMVFQDTSLGQYFRSMSTQDLQSNLFLKAERDFLLLGAYHDKINFNKRVVIHAEGTIDGTIVFESQGERIALTPKEFSARLVNFFRYFKLDVQYIDMLMTNGDYVLQPLYDALKASGLDNFNMRGFLLDCIVVPTGRGESSIDVRLKRTNKQHLVDIREYIFRGKMPEGLSSKSIALYRSGNPSPIDHPAVPAIPAPCSSS